MYLITVIYDLGCESSKALYNKQIFTREVITIEKVFTKTSSCEIYCANSFLFFDYHGLSLSI